MEEADIFKILLKSIIIFYSLTLMSIELEVLTVRKSSSQLRRIKFLNKVRTQTIIPKGRID